MVRRHTNPHTPQLHLGRVGLPAAAVGVAREQSPPCVSATEGVTPSESAAAPPPAVVPPVIHGLMLGTNEHNPVVACMLSSSVREESLGGSSTTSSKKEHLFFPANKPLPFAGTAGGGGSERNLDTLVLSTSGTTMSRVKSCESDFSEAATPADTYEFDTLEDSTVVSIGRGAQGTVYRVTLADGTVFAVKRMAINTEADASGVGDCCEQNAAVVRELNTAVQLGQNPSPYLVNMECAVYQTTEPLHEVVLYMELLRYSAADLLAILCKYQRLNCGAFDLRKPLMRSVLPVLAHDVLQGLAHLHNDLSRCHNDVKLENILLRQDGKGFKVADFGCALKLGPNGTALETVSIGNFPNRPPERLGFRKGKRIECNAKSDVWALGLILVEVVSDHRDPVAISPFGSRHKRRWKHRVLRVLSLLPPEDDTFRNFVTRCLQLNVCDRWDAKGLLQDPWLSQHSTESLDGLREELSVMLTGMEKPTDAVKLTQHFVAQLNKAAKKLWGRGQAGGKGGGGNGAALPEGQLVATAVASAGGMMPSSPSREFLDRSNSKASLTPPPGSSPTTTRHPKMRPTKHLQPRHGNGRRSGK